MTSGPQDQGTQSADQQQSGAGGVPDAGEPPVVDSVEVVESNQPLDEWGED
jgi:hypothetical protein